MKIMKKMKTNILTLAALLLAGAAVVSCSKDDEMSTPEAVPASAKTYTMTVEANKGDVTRALADAVTTLTSTWTVGDVVKVYNSTDTEIGTLTAQTTGASTVLSGALTTKPNDGETLTLKYLSASYGTQDGTLTGSETSIDKVCDYSTASVTATVSGEAVSTTAASFVSQQAVVKFTLKNKATASALNVDKLFVTAGGITYTVQPTAAASVLYVAVPAISSKQVTLTAQSGSTYYDFAKAGISFASGSFYRINAGLVEVKAMAEADAASVGRVIGNDGMMYVNVKSAVNAGQTASAIIAYVGSATGEAAPYNHGLAIAMNDAASLGSSVRWSSSYDDESLTNYTDVDEAVTTAQSGRSNSQTSGFDNESDYPAFYAALHNTITEDLANGISKAAPAGTSGWFLPSLYQWNKIVQGLSGQSADLSDSGNANYSAPSLNTKIEAAGGTGLWYDSYWSSTEYDNDNAWLFNAGFMDGKVNYLGKGSFHFVRSVLAF